MKKILFITPPFHAGVVEVAGSWVPLYMVYVAGAAKAAGFEAEIYDAMSKQVGYPEIEARIRESDPDCVAVSAITCTSPDAVKVIELAKKINPAIKTVLGGIHPTFMYEELFGLTESLDFIIRGEGEITIAELLKTLSDGGDLSGVDGLVFKKDGKLVVNGKRKYIEDLDSLTLAWDLLDWTDYTYYVIPNSRLGAIATSRGCEKECTFCSQQKFWERSWRARSPQSLVAEMEELKTKYGVNVVLFTDDYPTPDRARWETFLDLAIEKDLDMYILMETRAADIIRDKDILHKYRKAGIIHIYVGTESTEQASLDYIKKDLSVDESIEAIRLLREAGIITETSMILGFPEETMESVERTLSLAIDLNPDFAHFLAIAPWPYADIYKELKEYITVYDYTKYNLIDPVIKPTNMTLQDLDTAIVECYRGFYMMKFAEMMEEKDLFKKQYMLTAMKLMMSNSFIRKKMGDMKEMPEEMKRIIGANF
ncbi:MAG: cobalamin B12-binding domain-containing protein [Nitrospirae bacterium]|nr:cobalamin B12-binding domain-containing protein [Nitrospirota bacterium]